MSLLLETDRTKNILTPNNLNTSYDIFNIIYDTDDMKYKDLLYPEICMKDYPSSPFCSSTMSNIFGAMFQNNISKWQNQQTILNIINNPTSLIQYFVGGIQYDEEELIINSANVLT